jgi:ornithine decarboxylase
MFGKKLLIRKPEKPLIERLHEYKTPFFAFEKIKIIKNINEFKNCFPEASIFYAMKANSEPEILEIIAKQGVGFEVASKYELDMLRRLKVSPKKIIYGTAVKPHSHIKEFADYGVDTFAADSFPELEKIASAAPSAKVYIRALVSDTGSIFKFSDKFGTWFENIPALLERARDLGLTPYGISFNVGSQASNATAWAEAIKSLVPIFESLKRTGIELQMINFGGGYPCEYASTEDKLELKNIAKFALEEYSKLSYRPKIFVEPGRGIVGDTSVLVSTVIARVERQQSTWLFLDSGPYNALFEAMAYQGSTRYKVTSMRHSYDSGVMMYALAGPTGDSQDVITKEAPLPRDIDVGDKLIFHNVGAYNLVATTPFNGFPRPDVYIE